uniref:Uncharacterized protein n=1 Tax=Aegilops tauschii TaxID=37682 RepID=R7WDV3_AEGTA
MAKCLGRLGQMHRLRNKRKSRRGKSILCIQEKAKHFAKRDILVPNSGAAGHFHRNGAYQQRWTTVIGELEQAPEAAVNIDAQFCEEETRVYKGREISPQVSKLLTGKMNPRQPGWIVFGQCVDVCELSSKKHFFLMLTTCRVKQSTGVKKYMRLQFDSESEENYVEEMTRNILYECGLWSIPKLKRLRNTSHVLEANLVDMKPFAEVRDGLDRKTQEHPANAGSGDNVSVIYQEAGDPGLSFRFLQLFEDGAHLFLNCKEVKEQWYALLLEEIRIRV